MHQRLFCMFLACCMIGPGACTQANHPLNDLSVPLEHRRRNDTRSATFTDLHPIDFDESLSATRPGATGRIQDADGTFVGVAISGGGLRSSNFAAACLLQLQKNGVLQRADYISCVSGGSLTAAYYCLAPDDAFNVRNLQRRLAHPFATDLFLAVIQPWNGVALMATDWDTSDILASRLDKVLFRHNGKSATFDNLRADRPRLLINATDLQSGNRFVFCNEAFDQINSDLSRYPIAHAVAASAAFPIALHDKTLRDYSTAFKQYRHLIDGGVNDNLGIQTLLEVYEAQNQLRRARNGDANGPVPYPNGAVLIVIDAGTRYDADLSEKGDIGFLEEAIHGAGLSSTALVNRASAASLSDVLLNHSAEDLTAGELREQRRRLANTGHLLTRGKDGRRIEVVHLSLMNISRLTDVPFASFSASLDRIATFFNIEEKEIYRLYQAADLLIRTPEMREALARLSQSTTRPR